MKEGVVVGVGVTVFVGEIEAENSLEAVKVFPKDMAVSANSACVF